MTTASASNALGLPVVHLVDDEAVVRDAIAWLLRSRRLLSESHASAEQFEEAFLALDRSGQAGRTPTCLLLDLRMGGMSGLALFDRLLERGATRTMPVIFLTGHADIRTAIAAVKRGAFDFLEKPFSNNALVDRIEEALHVSAQQLLAQRDQAHRRKRLDELSGREQEVMRLIASGMPNKSIADTIDVSVRTVEVHRARIFDKLGVRSAVELANWLHGNG
jgi:two-component system response regulator DctR